MLPGHLLEPKFLVKEESHLLVERTWKRIGNKSSEGNCIDVFHHVKEEVSIRSGEKEKKATNITGKLGIFKYFHQETKIWKISTPRPTKGLFSSI